MEDQIIEWLSKYSEQAILNHLVTNKGYSSIQAKELIQLAIQKKNAQTKPIQIEVQSAQPIKQVSNSVESKTSKTSKTSKMVSVRLPIELYDLIKDRPSRRIKNAIKSTYVTPVTQHS